MTTHHTSDNLIAEIDTYLTERSAYNARLEEAYKAVVDAHNAWCISHAPMNIGAMLTCSPTPDQRQAEASAHNALVQARAVLKAVKAEQEIHTADDGYWSD
jgi:hypothetical protein